jgi:hypothetical protein
MKVVFVHIGENPTPTLFKAAEIAGQSLPEAEICLISDQQNLLRDFPGTRVQYNPDLVQPFLRSFIKKNKELKNLAGGYWLNTIVRLFALIQVAQLKPDETTIHLESDVYLYATIDDLIGYQFSQEFISYPRLSRSRGIASILYSPNLKTLEEFLFNLQKILNENNGLTNDMDLLGNALNMEIAKELKSVPGVNVESAGGNYIFDGAALGQYLLGVDPVHTSGSVVGGFQNSDYPIELSNLNWSIPKPGKIVIGYKEMKYEVLSLHAHSKEILGYPDINNDRWKQIIREANLEVPREINLRDFKNIHLGIPSFRNRIRIARKNGFLNHLRKYLNRRLKTVMKKPK